MPFGIFILFVSVFFPLTVWVIKNEEQVVELEDKMFQKIKSRFSKSADNEEKTENRIYVVERKENRYNEMRSAILREDRNFVA